MFGATLPDDFREPLQTAVDAGLVREAVARFVQVAQQMGYLDLSQVDP